LSPSRLLRLLVAVGLTAIVLYTAHPSEVLAAAVRADWRWIGAAVGLVLLDRALMALRWISLLSALTPGSRPPFSVVLRIFFVSSFVSNFVPSVAADMYRAYALARHDVHLAESTASVLMDRTLGVLSMALVGAAALPFASGSVDQRALVLGLSLAFGGCAVAAALVFSETVAAAVQRISVMIPIAAVRHAAVSLTDAVRRYARHHGELIRVLIMSVLVQTMRILQAWCLGRSLGIELPLATYFVFVPVILLVMQLPITINGFGTTQFAFQSLFVPAGAPASHTFALSILFLALGIAGSLPGGLMYATSNGFAPLTGRRPPKPSSHESNV
jgi:glycosyltransferase 2 family protein